MVIEFICPNGHQLTAPDAQAGKPGKCPKCDTSFLVPDPNEPDDGSEHDGGNSDADIIVFLCPEGHKLNGPASLKGKPGQCPHCGSKFRIPDDDDDEETFDHVEHAETSTQHSRDPGGSSAEMEEIPEVVEVAEEAGSSPRLGGVPSPAPSAPNIPAPHATVGRGAGGSPEFSLNGESSFPEIFAWLWQQREERSTVEIHLKSGEVFTPRFFSPAMSHATHAVFASQDEFGKYSVSAIAWDAIARIGMRNLGSVPKELFQ